MTEQEQRIALANYLDSMTWPLAGQHNVTFSRYEPQGSCIYFLRDDRPCYSPRLPDTNSLDVLHEMEMKLDAISDNYLSSLQPNRIYRVMLADRVAGKKLWDNGTFIGSQWDIYGAISATAAQRREVLCRTLFPERFK